MRKRRWIMWHGLIAPSLERFIAAPTDNGFELRGLILQANRESPYVVRYQIIVDGQWTTQSVELELENGGNQSITLSRRSGRWSIGGKPRLEFDPCVDVDIEWSPSTNTLPIRRLSPEIGETRAVTALWIRLPALTIEPLQQSYERLGEHRYRYRSGDFSADLEVDDDGWVMQYGTAWNVVATSG